MGSLLIVFMLLVENFSSSDIDLEFNITDASIKQFTLTSDNTLYYNLKLNVKARNLKEKILYSEMITAISSYKDNEFAVVVMAPFVIAPKNTIMLKQVVFEGNSLIKLKPQQVVEYNNETQLGFYNVNLRLEPYAHCLGLRVPMISNGKLEPTFNVTKCA
ncbi:NDR1/HIN1-like protein 10 [Vicia villosa]|uniref:NDR1/HIN1-like protein 10 n=1 Tax=Vicia villosa TaxID=3911 RepID=UPI00273CBF18|nr:NDR1/HIN1-like protein 10 [Vicia villosa]